VDVDTNIGETMINYLKDKLKSLAIAEAIIEPEWEYRYFSYDSNWSNEEEMASMRDGSGGHWFVLFQDNQIGYKCISPNDGLIENIQEVEGRIPDKYREFIEEPAFYRGEATAIWLLDGDDWIKYGKESVKYIIDLEQVIEWTANDYKEWAEEYYEKDINIDALKSIFEHKISDNVVKKLNKELSLTDIAEDLKEIGVIC